MASLRSTIARLFASARRGVLPAVCCLCDQPGQLDVSRSSLDLCALCQQMLRSNTYPCAQCALPLDAWTVRCRACRGQPPAHDGAFAPYLYMYPLPYLVRGLKFQGNRVYGRLLGQLLAGSACGSRRLPQALVPIPLHASRYRQRGFNQARDIAAAAAGVLDLPLEDRALTRVLPTLAQSGLSLPERRANVRAAFRAEHVPRARSVALVDDVLTTGSTATEAARALKDAGVPHVEIWAVARVRVVRRSSV
jgi:ComF family protein